MIKPDVQTPIGSWDIVGNTESTIISRVKRLLSRRTQFQVRFKLTAKYHTKAFMVYNQMEEVRGQDSNEFVRYSRWY